MLITCGTLPDNDPVASPVSEPDESANSMSKSPTPEPTQPQDETSDPNQPQDEDFNSPLPGSEELDPDPPPAFGFIDAHADTISRVLLQSADNQSLYSNKSLDVDFLRLSEFEAPVQVFVAWCSNRYVSTAFAQTNKMFDLLESEIEKHSDMIEIALDLRDIERIAHEGKISAILAIEGGEALMGKIDNLEHFYNRGVRIMGLTWNRENELGYGQETGSTLGLKPFGLEVIEKMDEMGMIMDVSHLNEQGFWDAHEKSTRPYMASHSNAYAIMPHNRNLRDDQIMAIIESGGIIGFNMYPLIIAPTETATMTDILSHFRHLLDIGAGNHIGLGCDLDGIPSMPQGFTNVSSLKMFNELLVDEFDEETSYRIMEGNFYEFFKRYFES